MDDIPFCIIVIAAILYLVLELIVHVCYYLVINRLYVVDLPLIRDVPIHRALLVLGGI